MKYKVVLADFGDQLGNKVTGSLQAGWELYGTPFVSPAGDFCQAMTFKDHKERTKNETNSL
jgi:hypothetical protein